MDFEKIANDFIHTLQPKTYTKVDLYDSLLDYLEEKEIFCPEENENEIDLLVFKKASELGYLNAKVILTFDDMTKFANKMKEFLNKTNDLFFHITYEPKEEEALSFTEIWKNWKGVPPDGWIAGWCSCGHFYPYTFDIGAMDIENNALVENSFYKPFKIELSDIERVNFCSDGLLRLILKNGNVFAIKIYTLMKNSAIMFSDNPTDIFKLELM